MIRSFFLLFILASALVSAQPVYTQSDVEICNSTFELAVEKNLSDLPINEIIIEIGKSFIGHPYEAHTLEKGEKEELVVYLTGLDCYTFLESALVFARSIKKGNKSFEAYHTELENIRYRKGKLEGYPSRLHYFSDWIYDMDRRKIAEDVSKDIGGITYENNVNFMSTHPDSYKRLKNNPQYVEEMKIIEKEISGRDYYYIPQDIIETVEYRIKTGDIIGITTNIEGLDISHTGIAVRKDDGRIHLLHAPNIDKNVEITSKPLAEVIKSIKHQTGVMVARPKEPI